MSPISSSAATINMAYDMAVAKKMLANTREQGQMALTLIEGAAPAPSPQGSLGTRIDVRA
jgi:hypothetical protein